MSFLSISDTALWIAAYRALETKRRTPLIEDPFAEKLAGPRGFEMVKSTPLGRQMVWSLAVRTKIIDDLIEREIKNNGVNCVVNLACGLDTRPYRMKNLPRSLRWIEIDLPGMIEYKSNLLHDADPVCILQRISADLASPTDRKRALDQSLLDVERALVITEGLLCYVPVESVSDLARELRSYRAVRGWVSDLFSPELLEFSKRTWGKDLWYAKSGLYFAPKEGVGFFQSLGWKVDENRALLEEAQRLGRDFPMAKVGRKVLQVLPGSITRFFNDTYRLILLR